MAQLMPAPRRPPAAARGPRARAPRTRASAAAQHQRRQLGHVPAVAAGEHRVVDPLAAGVGAQEHRGGHAAERGGVQRRAGPVGPGSERRPHPPDLLDDHEQVAVHEGGDEHEQPRHAHRLQPAQDARERRGHAQQHRAHRADHGLGRHRREYLQALLVSGQGSELPLLPAVAHEGEEQAHQQDQRQHETGPAPDLPQRHPAGHRHGGQDRRAGHVGGPGAERGGHGHQRHRHQADDLGSWIQAMDRAGRVSRQPGQFQRVVADGAQAGAPRAGACGERRRSRKASP